MNKLLLITVIVLTAFTSNAQKAWKSWDHTQIPFNDKGEVCYTDIISCEGKTKDILYQSIRSWFVDNFVNSDAVLKMDDKESGRMMGKGSCVATWINGVNSHEVTFKFTLKIDVKDNKVRYKVYDILCVDKSLMLLGDLNDYQTYNVNLGTCYDNIEDGKRLKYNKRFLMNSNNNIKLLIINTLKDACVNAILDEW